MTRTPLGLALLALVAIFSNAAFTVPQGPPDPPYDFGSDPPPAPFDKLLVYPPVKCETTPVFRKSYVWRPGENPGEYCLYQINNVYYTCDYQVKGLPPGKTINVHHHWASYERVVLNLGQPVCVTYVTGETLPLPNFIREKPRNHNCGGAFPPPSEPPPPVPDDSEYNCHGYTIGLGGPSAPTPAPPPNPPVPPSSPGAPPITTSGPTGGVRIPDPGPLFDGPGFCNIDPPDAIPPSAAPEDIVYVIKAYCHEDCDIDYGTGKTIHTFVPVSFSPPKAASKNGEAPLDKCTTPQAVLERYAEEQDRKGKKVKLYVRLRK